MSIRQQLAGFKNQLVTASMLAPTFSNERVAPVPRNVTRHAPQPAAIAAPRVFVPTVAYCFGRMVTYKAASEARRLVRVVIKRNGHVYEGTPGVNLQTMK